MRVLTYLTLTLSFATAANGASILLQEDFRNDTAPGWVFQNSAELTGGNQDPLGEGWLRLTNPTGNETGFAYNTSAVPFDSGIEVTLEFKVWGWTSANPADGFAFTFFDGAVGTPTAGGYGGSLGYAQSNGNPGMSGGILGLGVDEFGNFSNPTEDRVGGPGFTPNSIVVRGPGSGSGSTFNGQPNYAYLASSGGGVQITSGDQGDTVRPTGIAEFRRIKLTVDTTQVPSGSLPITLQIATLLGGVDVTQFTYDAYDDLVAFYGDVSNIPSTVKFGFTASTGGQNAYHEIRGLQVLSINNVPGYPDQTGTVPEPSTWVLMLTAGGLLAIQALRKRRGGESGR